jgi:hypothetical protein
VTNDSRNINWRAVLVGLLLAFGMTFAILWMVARWVLLFHAAPPLPK